MDGRHVADPDFITLKGGFKPGLTYEIAYESQNPPVAGLGLAAVRDMASATKYDPAIVASRRKTLKQVSMSLRLRLVKKFDRSVSARLPTECQK